MSILLIKPLGIVFKIVNPRLNATDEIMYDVRIGSASDEVQKDWNNEWCLDLKIPEHAAIFGDISKFRMLKDMLAYKSIKF